MSRLTLIFAAIATLLLSGCAKEVSPSMRIALNAWPGYEYLYLAEQLGYFNDEGLEVTVLPFQTLSDSRRAFEKGQVDVLAATLVELYTIRDLTKLDPAVFLVADSSFGADVLLAHKKFPTVASLKGKKLALEPGTIDVLTAAKALASANMTFKDVEVVPLPQPNAVKALVEGKVDALQTWPPHSIEATKSPGIVKLYDTSKSAGDIVDVLIASNADMKKRPEDYRRVVRAFYRARDYQLKNPEDANARMAKRELITVAEFLDVSSGIRLATLADQTQYFGRGKLVTILADAHAALTSVNAIMGPACGTECLNSVPSELATK